MPMFASRTKSTGVFSAFGAWWLPAPRVASSSRVAPAPSGSFRKDSFRKAQDAKRSHELRRRARKAREERSLAKPPKT